MKNLGLLKAACFSVSLISVSTTILRADTVWTNWASATFGEPGTASGSLNGVTVSFNGEVIGNTITNGTSGDWSDPASSFIGGTVTTSPSTVGDMIAQDGSFSGINTLSFSTPVVNPVFAIWSLGSPSLSAAFTFNLAPTFEAGGTDVFGGGPMTVSADVVSGQEGSGVVQFTGSFASISWTNTFEFFYGFTVGESGAATATPEPSTLALCCACFAAIGLLRRRRSA